MTTFAGRCERCAAGLLKSQGGYCSMLCANTPPTRHRRTRVQEVCEWCKQVFAYTPRADKAPRRFCGRQCSGYANNAVRWRTRNRGWRRERTEAGAWEWVAPA
jgi:hypothetical protein